VQRGWSARRRIVAGLVAGALLIAGCGDDGSDDDGGAPPQPGGTSTEATSPDETVPPVAYDLPTEDLDGDVEGGTIVFHGVDGSRHLQAVAASGGPVSELAVDGYDGMGAPAVAPDGETVAALGWAPGAVELATSLLVGTLDGGLEPVLVDDELDMWCVRWFPSGDRLLLTAFVEESMDPELLIVGLDGSTESIDAPSGRFDCAVPVDESRAVLTYLGIDTTLVGAALLDLDTGEAVVLTEIIGCLLYGGSRSPGGDEIAVVATCEDPADSGLYVIDVDSGEAEQVVEAEVGYPAWSPTGEWLVFGVYESPSVKTSTVWVARRDGTGIRQVSDTIGTQPAWVR
jgi:hypothetical protein